MDEALERLRRAADASPHDAQLARRLEAALLRAGEREALQARYRFKFVCSRKFEELEGQTQGGVRHCRACDREVYATYDAESYLAAAREGKCVSVPTHVVDEALGLLAAAPDFQSAAEEGAPCLFGGLSWLEESAWPEVPRGLRLRVLGPLKTPRVSDFNARLWFLSRRFTNLLLDLSQTPATDSRMLGLLVKYADTVRVEGGLMVLLAPQRPVRVLLDMLGLDAFFALARTPEEAVQRVQENPPPDPGSASRVVVGRPDRLG